MALRRPLHPGDLDVAQNLGRIEGGYSFEDEPGEPSLIVVGIFSREYTKTLLGHDARPRSCST